MERNEDRRTENPRNAIPESLSSEKLSIDLFSQNTQHLLGRKDLSLIDHRLGLRRSIAHNPIQKLWNVAVPVMSNDQLVTPGKSV